MEEEISLAEIFITLWKGKYIIISITVLAMLAAALISVFAIVPLYRATAVIDAEQYTISGNILITKYSNTVFLASALEHLPDDGAEFIENIDVTIALLDQRTSDKLVGVTVKNPNPQLAMDAANTLVLEISKSILDDQLFVISEQLEEHEKATKIFEDYIIEIYGGELLYPMFIGERTQFYDPLYLALRQEQGIETAALFRSSLEQDLLSRKYEESFDYFVKQGIIIPASLPNNPATRGWPLNTAVAGVLGLMLSVFIVFMRPVFAEISKEIQESKNGNNA